ncbi:Protein ROOT HAIR DEFECTIVE 3 like 1 [Dendrobium catenatum]|uniref:Protein ROOT HAIR DEFECTIVE 3 like 1 n=1 Tax=Dendrobium catenatum TaxID=906689 RepID=A0A2I0V9Q4_9ASPA|nr:Protein ROOT HAIR DEFECTIVE 3 like 1 [Dendrobium catenatum]
MMWHLGYKTVEDFKVRFDKALGSGEGFSAAASNCFQSVMFAFNEACEGSLLEILIRFIELYIITIVRIVE